jgi:hypothetical protein
VVLDVLEIKRTTTMYLDLKKSSTSAATDRFAKLAVAFIYSVSPIVEEDWMDAGAGLSP